MNLNHGSGIDIPIGEEIICRLYKFTFKHLKQGMQQIMAE